MVAEPQTLEGMPDHLPVEELESSPAEREADEVNEALHQERAEAERASKKPFIDHLETAVIMEDDGTLLFVPKCHEKVVIERTVMFEDTPMWLDTRVYEVRDVNQKTGNINLFDPDMRQNAQTNFITGLARGYRFRIPGKKQRLSRKRPKKEKAVVSKEGRPKKAGGIRRIYDTKGVVHTRLKSVAYLPEGETKAKSGDRLQVTPDGTGKVTITHPEDGWTETWYLKEGM